MDNTNPKLTMPPSAAKEADGMPTSFGRAGGEEKPQSGQSASLSPQFSDTSKKRPQVKIIAIGVGVLLVITIAIMILGRRGDNTVASGTAGSGGTPGTPATRTIPTIDPTQPSVVFAATQEGSFPVGQEVVIRVVANSNGADVNGFDLLFPYDKEAFEIVDAVSINKAFRIYKHDRKTYFSITGIKDINVRDATPFSPESPVLELKVKANKPGTFYLEVAPRIGKETSKFVDKDITVINPQFQPIKLEFR
ncbi:MAG: hypothetical protein N2691_02795 [Patescibacteria group bacterium]|nr:hypothetical protein [Patescibacteria group bacterium]